MYQVKNNINNLKALEKYRKKLRNNSTSAEAVLWRYLKNRQLDGRRFRRQFSVGNRILDFYCPSEKLNIELDGAYHYTEDGMKADLVRDQFLNQEGITVLRFENHWIWNSLDGVLTEIKKHFKNPAVSYQSRKPKKSTPQKFPPERGNVRRTRG